MLFESIDENLYEAYNDFDISLMKVTAFFEASEREANILKEQASYDYMTESVGPYEYTSMYEEAESKLSSRFIEAVKKIIEAVKKFFADIRDKVIALYRDSKVSALISKAKEKIRMNPILKRKTTSPVPDYKAVMKCYDDEEDYLDRQAAACNTGNFDKDVFYEHETNYQIKLNEAKQKLIQVSTETLTKMIDDATKLMDKVTARSKEVCDAINKEAKYNKGNSELLTILKKKANVAKEKASYMISVVSKYTVELKNQVSSAIEKAKEGADNRREAKKNAKRSSTNQMTVKQSMKESVSDYSYNDGFDIDGYLDNIFYSLS